MTGTELSQLGAELGLDVVGAAPAEPYDDTERWIEERRQRGLFGDMRFTMAQPEISCHPEQLLEGARTVVAAALCYARDVPDRRPDHGRLPRYTWRDEYATLRERLDALGQRLGGRYRVLVDDNDHVDRAAAVRAGIAFFGKNTLAITRHHGSWVVLGVVVTDIEIEHSPRLELDCGACRLCIDACPTGALDEPGTLDSTKCLSYWTQTAAPIPEQYRAELGDMIYGCDICQDVCPWNRGVEKRRRGQKMPHDARADVSLREWLERDSDQLVEEFDRLYVPRNDARWLRRNALVAAGNVGSSELSEIVEEYARSEDEMLAETAAWALERIGERGQ
jgi:epoxyqueuosine reductase